MPFWQLCCRCDRHHSWHHLWFHRRLTDTFVSRLMDVFLAFPLLVFAIALAGVFPDQAFGLQGNQLRIALLIFIIGFFSWPYIGRIIRGQTLSLREREFVESARSIGARRGYILRTEMLPNLIAPILVYSTLLIPTNILFEAALSYLGWYPPAHPELGRDVVRRRRLLHAAALHVLARHGDLRHGLGLQPLRRRAARCSRSTSQPIGITIGVIPRQPRKGFRNEPIEILASQRPGRRGRFGCTAGCLRRGGPGGEQGPTTQAGASAFNARPPASSIRRNEGWHAEVREPPATGTPSTRRDLLRLPWNFARLYGRSLMMFKSAPGKRAIQLVPDLAEGPGEASSDAKTWTYKLRQGVKFEDGTEVTSADVKYAVLRSTDKQTFPNGPAYWEGLLDLPSGYKGPYKTPNMNTDWLLRPPISTRSSSTRRRRLQLSTTSPSNPTRCRSPRTRTLAPSTGTQSSPPVRTSLKACNPARASTWSATISGIRRLTPIARPS